jgi:hypothetical protein
VLNVKRHKKIKRTVTHLTISFPEDLAKELRKQKNYSDLLASLYRAHLEKEQATPSTPTMSAEEVNIREALKDRERFIELYGDDKIYDMEHAIRHGEEWSLEGVEDKNGYFEIYEKHMGQHSEETLYDLWHDVQDKVNAEKEKDHEARLKREVAPGMTLQDAIDRIDAYRQQKYDRKVQKLTEEAKAVKETPDALAGMQRKRINEEIKELTERFKKKEASYNDIMNALGLSYQEVYNKVAAALRLEGYKVGAGKTA